jgi:hypothetical protein
MIASAIYSASRLSNFIVQDLLDNQIYEHGKIEMNYEKFDLDYVIKDLFRILAPHSANKKNFF